MNKKSLLLLQSENCGVFFRLIDDLTGDKFRKPTWAELTTIAEDAKGTELEQFIQNQDMDDYIKDNPEISNEDFQELVDDAKQADQSYIAVTVVHGALQANQADDEPHVYWPASEIENADHLKENIVEQFSQVSLMVSAHTRERLLNLMENSHVDIGKDIWGRPVKLETTDDAVQYLCDVLTREQ